MEKDTSFKNIYGKPSVDVVISAQEARQFSPLLPGSQSLEECPEGSLDGLAMLAPFGTLERHFTLALALLALAPQAPFLVMAPKDKGGSRLKQELVNFGCNVVEKSRKHLRICSCSRPLHLADIQEAVAKGAPRFIDDMGFWSQPGIFSWDRLDPGSTLLVQNLPLLAGSGADFGCGFGYLSRHLLRSSTLKHLTLIDIDRRAIACAQRNIEDKRTTFLWANVFSPSPPLNNLDFVVMNPPFHDAGIENQTMGQKFIEQAHNVLRPGGVCWMTANRHLPYEKVLSTLYKTVTLKAEDNGYKVYEAIK